MSTAALPSDVKHLSWAAEQLGIGESTAYRLAATGQLPGVFKVGAQWRVSVPRFLREVHGETGSTSLPPPPNHLGSVSRPDRADEPHRLA